MGLTLAQARDVVEDFLDDATNARWSTAQIDVALGFALSACMNDYLAAGGDRFDELQTSTSSAVDGTINLSSVDPYMIRGVTCLVGNRNYPITEIGFEERGVADTTARSITIRYVRGFVLPTNTSHPLVGNGATAGKTWVAFDHWVCAKAALYCSIKDAEGRPELAALEKDARENAIFTSPIPKSYPFPSRPFWYSAYLQYAWNQSAQTLIVCRKGY